MVDGRGVPLAAAISAANTHDSKMAVVLIDAVPGIRGKPGMPRCRPKKLHGDKGYASRAFRAELRKRGITPRIARRGIESKERLGRYRWVVERTISWLHAWKKLRTRYERRDDIHQALLTLACSMICYRSLRWRAVK